MKFRRSLMMESFQAEFDNETPETNDQIINSVVSIDEADLLVEEGEDLANDSDLVTKTVEIDGVEGDELGEKARTLIVENFVNKWGVRTLNSESLVAYDEKDTPPPSDSEGGESKKNWAIRLWERFLKWLDGFIETIKSKWREFTSSAKKYRKIHDKLKERLKKLGTNPKKVKEFKLFFNETLARLFYIDNDMTSFSIVSDLPGFVKEVSEDLSSWMQGNTSKTSHYIKLEEGKKGRFTREGFESLKQISGTNYFKSLNKKLKKIGPKDSKEEQFLIPVINNDYLQCFTYTEEIKLDHGRTEETVVNGVRYVAGGSARIKSDDIFIKDFDMKVGATKALEVRDMITLLNLLDQQIVSLKNIEDNYSKVEKDIVKMRDETKRLAKELKSKSITDGERNNLISAHRVSREAVFSSQHSYRFIFNLNRNCVMLTSTVVDNSLKCWKAA